jgi:hypothetical protein
MPSYSLPTDLVVDDVLLSADGTRCRYLASDQRTTHLFVDGNSLGSWATRRGQARQLASSPDLGHHAWVSRGKGSVKVVTSKGNQFGPYSEVGLRSEAFAAGQLKFVARRGAQSFVQLGDERLGPFAEVGDLGILDESGAIAFAFRRGRSWFAWIEGRETGPYEGLVYGVKPKKRGPPRIRRLADGRPVVLGGAGTHFALHVGKETEILRCSRANVEVCGLRVIIECGRDPTTVLLDGKVLAEVETVRSIRSALGPGAKRVGFAFDQASFAGFYLDGKRFDGFGYTDGPWWSDDGAHVAWGQGDEEPAFVVDDEGHPQPHRIDWGRGDDFGFGPDGRFHAVLMDEERGAPVVVAGKERHGPFEALLGSGAHKKSILTSRDGELAFAYRAGDGDVFLRARGREHRVQASRRLDWILTPRDRIVAAFVTPNGREVRVEEVA